MDNKKEWILFAVAMNMQSITEQIFNYNNSDAAKTCIEQVEKTADILEQKGYFDKK